MAINIHNYTKKLYLAEISSETLFEFINTKTNNWLTQLELCVSLCCDDHH